MTDSKALKLWRDMIANGGTVGKGSLSVKVSDLNALYQQLMKDDAEAEPISMNANQNAREPMLPEDLVDRIWDRLYPTFLDLDGGIYREISRDQLCDAMTDAALNALDYHSRGYGMTRVDPPVASLVHELDCMADRMAESGLQGNAAIARRASRFIAMAWKHVTRFLPSGQDVHSADHGDLVTEGEPWVGHGGAVYVRARQPSGGECMAFTIDELEPVYRIAAEPNVGWTTAFIRDPERMTDPPEVVYVRTEPRDIREFDSRVATTPSSVEGVGNATSVAVGGEVHHLSIDSDQEITLHGPWAGWSGNVAFEPDPDPDRHNCSDDEFPS